MKIRDMLAPANTPAEMSAEGQVAGFGGYFTNAYVETHLPKAALTFGLGALGTYSLVQGMLIADAKDYVDDTVTIGVTVGLKSAVQGFVKNLPEGASMAAAAAVPIFGKLGNRVADAVVTADEADPTKVDNDSLIAVSVICGMILAAGVYFS